MDQRVRWWLVGVSGGAAVFRFHGLFANTFQADEALFATWARLIAVWRDPLLRTQLVDKPPLLFYGQALFYPLQGPVEWAARLPDLIASLLCVPLVGLLAWRLYRDGRTAVLAAIILALCPLAIRFSPTAFTDPLLTTLLYASLTLTVIPNRLRPGIRLESGRRDSSGDLGMTIGREGFWSFGVAIWRYGSPGMTAVWAGLLFGLALATKYQALLFLPLVIGTAVLSGWHWRLWRQWFLGLLPVLLLLLLWDVARTGAFSLWPTQISNYGGLRLIWSWELAPRLAAWWQLWRLAWGTAVVAGGFWVAALYLLVIGNPLSVIGNPLSVIRYPLTDYRSRDWLFVLFIIAYLALHWLLAVPVWDRYLLPLLPLAAIILARGWRRFETGDSPLASRLSPLVLPLLILLLNIPAFYARSGQPTADQGTGQIAALLADAPYGTVLYDHWYSWHWRYHLFDRRVYVNWFPHPAALTEDLAVFGGDGNPRYLILPTGEVANPMRRAVQTAGFTLQPFASDDLNHITLYAIEEGGDEE
jgi:4-amino-4-deoxy-L-arabinose transferase-like glycosyltransferase